MKNSSTTPLLPACLLWLLALCTACTGGSITEKGQIEEQCDSFANYYFNWHFDKAMHFVTPESEKWLRFAASNVTEDDVAQLRAKDADATIEIEDVDLDDDDSTAHVTVKVVHFLQMDSIGQAAHLTEEGSFRLTLSKTQDEEDGTWKVRMEGLPRSGKKSHD